MPETKEQTQRQDRSHETTSQAANRPATPDRSSDRERNIQTSRDSDQSLARRQQTSPGYGSGVGRFTPFTLMQRMAEDFDRLFENVGFGTAVSPTRSFGSSDLWNDAQREMPSGWAPQLETFRRGDKYIVRADLPGVVKNDVKVEVDNGVLTISGERFDEHEDDRDGHYQSERSYGSFYRAIALPDGANEQQCDASFKDGVLEVTLQLPKEPEHRTKQIPIR